MYLKPKGRELKKNSGEKWKMTALIDLNFKLFIINRVLFVMAPFSTHPPYSLPLVITFIKLELNVITQIIYLVNGL